MEWIFGVLAPWCTKCCQVNYLFSHKTWTKCMRISSSILLFLIKKLSSQMNASIYWIGYSKSNPLKELEWKILKNWNRMLGLKVSIGMQWRKKNIEPLLFPFWNLKKTLNTSARKSPHKAWAPSPLLIVKLTGSQIGVTLSKDLILMEINLDTLCSLLFIIHILLWLPRIVQLPICLFFDVAMI